MSLRLIGVLFSLIMPRRSAANNAPEPTERRKDNMIEFFRFAARYFRGWKRKIAVVTLGIACMITGWWIRSLYVWQTLPISSNEYGLMQFISADGTLEWDWITPVKMTHHDALKVHQQITSLLDKDREANVVFKNRRMGRHRLERGAFTLTPWFAPYWTMVIPLTLLSIVLLLRAPCTSTSKQFGKSALSDNNEIIVSVASRIATKDGIGCDLSCVKRL